MTPTADTVAILAYPGGLEPRGEGLLAKLDRVARYKRNARGPEYMRQVAAATFPHARLVEVDGAVQPEAISQARQIVLLWPDAVGYDWAPIERQVFRHKRADADVYALTGRRRTFLLTAPTLFGLRARRFAERFWLGEAVVAVSLLISAPFLVLWDFARGHR